MTYLEFSIFVVDNFALIFCTLLNIVPISRLIESC